jgi:DNA-directed RNA polymerase specialized sigma24 family protein
MSRPTVRKKGFGDETLLRLDAIYHTALWFNENGRDTQDLVLDTYNEASRIQAGSFSKTDCKILMFKILMKNLFRDVGLNFREHLPDNFEDKLQSFPSVDISGIKKIPAHVVAEVIKNLPLEIQLVIILSNLKIFTYAEIAEIFDIHRETVRLKISQGFRLIRRDLFNYVASANI